MTTENSVPDDDRPKHPEHRMFTIRIDQAPYEWREEKITGAQLRRLPPTPIPPDRDLFEVVPGRPDRQIKDDDTVLVHDGLNFITAPRAFTIRIDRAEYPWREEKITGAQLRRLPPTPIPPDRDLFEVVPGRPDRQIKDDDTVLVHDGLNFITAPRAFTIRIDRAEYPWREEKITGAQLRRLPPTPIPPDRDLFEVVPGRPDRQIKDDDTVLVHDGLNFITAPRAFTIRIDRAEYPWREEKITGAQLRRLPPTPIPPDRDLFEVVPGRPDRQIKDDDTVLVHDGLNFITAPRAFTIRIDRTEYRWREEKITGAQLRRLPSTPIPPDRDIFQVVPGRTDRQIKDDDTVQVHDGLRFFTAPNTINPGAESANHRHGGHLP
jgi:hypothetical protein